MTYQISFLFKYEDTKLFGKCIFNGFNYSPNENELIDIEIKNNLLQLINCYRYKYNLPFYTNIEIGILGTSTEKTSINCGCYC